MGFFFLNGAAREIAQFVCLPGMNKTLGSVFSTAYSGMLVQTLLSRLSEAEVGRSEVQGHSGL